LYNLRHYLQQHEQDNLIHDDEERALRSEKARKERAAVSFSIKQYKKKCIVIQICIMNQFNPTTFLCLSQAMNWILNVIICHGLFVLSEFRFDEK